jgi:hypothetical protein
LKERQEHLWETIKAMDEPPLALITSSMERLSELIEKAEPILQAGLPVADPGDGSPVPFHPSQPVNGEGGSSVGGGL